MEYLPGNGNSVQVNGVTVHGIGIDSETRCAHYHTENDVLAILFPCCNRFFSCRTCHDQLTGSTDHQESDGAVSPEFVSHEPQTWSAESAGVEALLCGVCGTQFKIERYLAGGEACPNCQHPFNPGCKLHRHLYFWTDYS